MKPTPTRLALAAALLFPVNLQGAILIQELFDNAGADIPIAGQGGTGSSIGLTGTWSDPGIGGMTTANNFNVEDAAPGLPGLPSNAGANGGVWRAGGADWNTGIYTTIGLTSAVDFSVTGTLYFSVRLNNGGDTSMGIGLANGSAGSSEFVGAGLTWNTATSLGSQDAANAAYISHGTLGQDLDGNNDGPYAIQASEAAGGINGPTLLVGQIMISATGDDLIRIMRYGSGESIATNPAAVSWLASSAFDSNMAADHLLLWLNGNGNGELDAIRFGESWSDVTGVPEPTAPALLALGAIAGFRRRRHQRSIH
ncbi:PEP-CTERM sorting domain-containing protein [Luteolibacter marinus]|uniref:PEP-CTERM sorting domain-containing protein n=1 Tax=Luteolibacter marinus TaxID=2776705 RepID=UPI0018664B13|nr:PEP-CTERM sorting domain-containing protein [Luteolibacter marinus]